MNKEAQIKEMFEIFNEFNDTLLTIEINYTEGKAMELLSLGRSLRDKMVELRALEDCPDDIKEAIDKELPIVNEQINTLDIELGIN